MGERATVVLLHGIPDSGRVWDGVAARLAGVAHTLAPDLPGFGANRARRRVETLADLGAATAELVADAPPRFTLVGHDVGALFGLAWAVAHPARLAGLVVINASIFPDRRWHWGARLVRTPGLGELAMRLTSERAFRAELRRASRGGRDAADIARTYAAFGPAARRATLALYRAQTPAFFADLPARVGELAAVVPTRVLWGDRDPYLPPTFAERFGAGAVVHYPELGHWPHVEAPGRVAAAIRSFLAAGGAAGFVAT